MAWWRHLFDQLTGDKPGDKPGASVVGPRRRKSERFPFAVELKLKCESWPSFVELFSGDVSEGGFFIPTAQTATLGDGVEIELMLPNQRTIRLAGKVANVVTASDGAKIGRRAGLGIELDELPPDEQEIFGRLLAAARGATPSPPGASTRAPAPRKKPPAVASSTPEPIIIGIDFGTTYISVSFVAGSKVLMCPWPDGTRSSPSVVSFPTRDRRLVGAAARQRAPRDPKHTISSPKRLLGRSFDDPAIQGFLGHAAYPTSPGPDQSVITELWGEQVSIVQVCSYIIQEACKVARTTIAQDVERCVLTVPVTFDRSRTRTLCRAAQLAGLEVVSLIDEPSSAALANRFDPEFGGGVVGVYDFGGGTFDFSIVDIRSGDFEVLATAGDTWLGGDDFDNALAQHVADRIWRAQNVDLRNKQVEWQRLLFACEVAKRELSAQETAVVVVREAIRTARGMANVKIPVNRATLEKVCRPAIDSSLTVCDQALAQVNMKPNDLHRIYLSGGTTHIPAVRRALSRHFRAPIRASVPPEQAVCIGAALHAYQISHRVAPSLPSRD